MVNTVGLVLHPRRDAVPAIDTIVEWARRRSATVLGLPDEVGRVLCDAEAVGQDQMAARADLLVSLFSHGSPLHDGAVILVHGRVSAAGCLLPLSTNQDLASELRIGRKANHYQLNRTEH